MVITARIPCQTALFIQKQWDTSASTAQVVRNSWASLCHVPKNAPKHQYLSTKEETALSTIG